MLTVVQVALRLGVSRSLVYGLCARGLLPHERYGLGRGTIRVSEESLAGYVASCRREAPERASEPPLKHIKLT